MSKQEVITGTYTKVTSKNTGFSDGELKRARKKLKKTGVAKPWLVTITNIETGTIDTYEL